MKSSLLFLFTAGLMFAANPPASEVARLNGAWRSTSHLNRTMLVQDGYFVQAQFDAALRIFEGTYGGPFTWSDGRVNGKIEFNSIDPSQVGSDFSVRLVLDGDKMVIGSGDDQDTWTRLDSGKSRIAGTWRLSARETNGRMNDVPPAPRRMLKLVSEKRYQWITFDVATGTFVGTSGGTYSLEDGKYTEKIEFFSGNDSRVGLALTFDAEIKDGKWHHRGKGSAGDSIHQVWSRL